MRSVLRVTTPQFRTTLIRKLKNIAPDHAVEFLEVERGISFRLVDRQGRARTLPITMHRNNGHALERAKLETLLIGAGFVPAVERQAARRLARLGGRDLKAKAPPRRRPG
jgi:hypothetical protein